MSAILALEAAKYTVENFGGMAGYAHHAISSLGSDIVSLAHSMKGMFSGTRTLVEDMRGGAHGAVGAMQHLAHAGREEVSHGVQEGIRMHDAWENNPLSDVIDQARELREGHTVASRYAGLLNSTEEIRAEAVVGAAVAGVAAARLGAAEHRIEEGVERAERRVAGKVAAAASAVKGAVGDALGVEETRDFVHTVRRAAHYGGAHVELAAKAVLRGHSTQGELTTAATGRGNEVTSHSPETRERVGAGQQRPQFASAEVINGTPTVAITGGNARAAQSAVAHR